MKHVPETFRFTDTRNTLWATKAENKQNNGNFKSSIAVAQAYAAAKRLSYIWT
jgi:hypothetical protein